MYNRYSMLQTISHTIDGHVFHLSHNKVAYWENTKTLLVADTHFGKTGHFQKHGVPVPQGILEHDLLRLTDAMEEFQPERVLFLGDFFHSTFNDDISIVRVWRNRYREIPMELVMGNHDILPLKLYAELNLTIVPQTKQESIFTFQHYPSNDLVPEGVVVCGHVHPSVVMVGKAKQRLKLPCFYIGNNHFILPAFGEFSGHAEIVPNKGDEIYIVTRKGILSV